jgi:hypothetical protein
MATNENNLSEETLATLEIIKNYAKSKDDWWLEIRIDILEVQIGIEKNNAKIEVYKSLKNGTN